jgi:hypothetical protein
MSGVPRLTRLWILRRHTLKAWAAAYTQRGSTGLGGVRAHAAAGLGTLGSICACVGGWRTQSRKDLLEGL